MKVVAVIPARLDSQRLPGKVLREVLGKPLIQWVYERVARAQRVDRVWVATDSPEVEQACRKFTDRVHRSTEKHECGSDRVAELARDTDADLMINVQCDEPMMEPELVDAMVDLFADESVKMASAAAPIKTREEFVDPNIVKVIHDRAGDALYFSRAPIPWPREHPPSAEDTGPLAAEAIAYKHIGIYAYRTPDLLEMARHPRTTLERLESLEQLRAQEYGWKIRMLVWDYKGIDVDTEEDLERMRQALEREGTTS